MRAVTIKAVMLVSGEDYIIHGSSDHTSKEMFMAIAGGAAPVWSFDPANEMAHYVELEVLLPELEGKRAIDMDNGDNDLYR